MMTEEKTDSASDSSKSNGDLKKLKTEAEQAEPEEKEVEKASKNNDSKKDKTGTSSKMIGRCFETESANLSAHSDRTSKVQKDTEIHYYIELLDNGLVALELIDKNGEPSGQLIEDVSKELFSSRFKTCSQHECPLQPSTLNEIENKMAENRAKMGEEHLEKGELNEAKDKFKRALKFDEKSVRANFGLGKTLLSDGKVSEAVKTFEDLSKIDALFKKENKHVFNKFGIELRSLKMYDLAITNYEKAILIDPKDEALYYNLSIAYEKKGLIFKAIEKLKEALDFKNDFPQAQKRLKALLVVEQKSLGKMLEKPESDEKK